MVERWAILFSGEFLWIFCSTVIVACVCVCALIYSNHLNSISVFYSNNIVTAY